MRIETLQYILEVARAGSISAAAKNLWIGQTTLSAAIQSAEKELGLDLFLRTSRGIILTPRGKNAVRIIERILGDYQTLTELSKHAAAPYGSCNVGCYPAFCTRLGSYLTLEKEARFSENSLNVIPVLSRKSVAAIAAGKCEIAIGTLAKPEFENLRYAANLQNLKFEILAEDYFCAIVNRASRHWGKKDINIQAIREDALVSMSYSPQFTGSFPVTNWKNFQQQSVLGDLESVKQAVAASDCVGITPHFSVIDDLYLRNGLIWPIRLTGFDSSLLIFMAYKPEVEQSAFSAAMLSKIRAIHQKFSALAQQPLPMEKADSDML